MRPFLLSRFGSIAGLLLCLVAATPAWAECGVSHDMIDHQIREGIFRSDKPRVLPPPVLEALQLMANGDRAKAAAIFTAMDQVPERMWRRDKASALLKLDAHMAAYLLNDCPPIYFVPGASFALP